MLSVTVLPRHRATGPQICAGGARRVHPRGHVKNGKIKAGVEHPLGFVGSPARTERPSYVRMRKRNRTGRGSIVIDLLLHRVHVLRITYVKASSSSRLGRASVPGSPGHRTFFLRSHCTVAEPRWQQVFLVLVLVLVLVPVCACMCLCLCLFLCLCLCLCLCF